jgi:hypothetical protein
MRKAAPEVSAPQKLPWWARVVMAVFIIAGAGLILLALSIRTSVHQTGSTSERSIQVVPTPQSTPLRAGSEPTVYATTTTTKTGSSNAVPSDAIVTALITAGAALILIGGFFPRFTKLNAFGVGAELSPLWEKTQAAVAKKLPTSGLSSTEAVEKLRAATIIAVHHARTAYPTATSKGNSPPDDQLDLIAEQAVGQVL